MSSYEKGANVWYHHPVETWIPTTVLAGGSGEITVKTEDGEEFKVETDNGNVMPLHPSSLTAVEDMVSLGDMNNAALLHNLRLRYWEDEIFTYIGPILIAVNPYKALPIFSPAMVEMYFHSSASESLQPHVYELANNAFKNMQANKQDQSVVISGESGAGKTEETKLTLQYLASVAGGSSSGQLGKEQLLLQSSPILESFGNAKTVRNNNSSRFGKYMQIMFSKQLKIVGGSTIKYLLEKSRVIKLGPGERNYHVFYMLFQQDATKKKAMGLEAGPKEFYYTNQSGVYEADGWKDDKEWEDSMAAWKMLGVEQEEIDNIYQMVAGVLWLGNHTFSGEDDSEIDDDDVTDKAAALFEADAEMMSTTLTYRNMQSGGRSIVVIPLKPAQAEESRDGLAKAAYDRLFSWVVDRVNEASKAESDTMSFIGVLDIFGFEIFELNSFEQLCINLANEKLQSHFNGHIFKLEQQIYLEEELKIDKIEFVDNQECLDLIEKKPKGILPMLDEECVVPKGSDMSLIQKLTETHRKSPFFEKPRKKGQESTFVVNHYAGGVAYGIDNFLDKNRDVLQPDVQSFMAGSKNSLVKTLFPPPAPKRGRAPTLGGQFKKSLQELYDKLMSTEPHFIKCVKPNTIKQPAVFDSKFTLRQLQYLGLLEVIRIRRLGYPVRRDPADFYQRYTCLDDGAAKNAQELAQKIGTADQWQMGKTKLFMKDEMYFGLETKRGMFMEERVKRLQSFLRSSLQGRVWQKNRQSIVIMQGFCRGVMARAIYARKIDERDADAALQEAIGERSKALLETAISKASDLDYAAPQLKEARELLERVKQEQRVQNLLDEAIEEESEDKLAVAIQEAADIDYMDSSVQKAKDIVADIKKKRMEEEEKKGKAEIARLKKEREDEARAALSSAISSTYSPRERRGQLQLAIAKADELIPDDPNIAKAKEELETLKASMGAKDMLDSAIESGDPDAIADAIEQSEGKPGVTAEEIDSAKKKLEEARSNKEVIKQLKDAMAGKSTEAVKAAVAAAGERGYDGEELQHAKLYLQQLESAKSNTKSAVLARSEGMEYEAMLDDQSKVMLIKNYEKLRQRDGASFTFSQLPIKTSLLTIPPGPSAQALTALSVSLFNSILGYTGASLMQYPALLAMEVLQKGLEQEDLRDEIYVQAVKQTFGSEGEVSARAWQMIYLCSKTFPPSEELFPFVRAHVYLCKTGRLEGVTAQDQVFADMLLQKLEKVYQDGAAESPPTQEAIQALRDREDITATIYFLDNSMKRYPITEETTIKQLLATIAKDLNYQQMDTCAIFDVKDFEHPQFLKQNLVIYKITQGWQAALKKGFKGKMRVKKTSSHKLVFRKRLYLSEPAEKITCPVDLHLLFSQARQDVAFGRFAITEVEALLLASLTLQIEYGDYDPKKHQGGFLRDILQEYIPANVYRMHKPKIWERDLLKTYEKMTSFTEVFAKKNYLRVVEKAGTYGFTMFPVKQTHMKKEPMKVFLGVNSNGIKIFRTDTKEPIAVEMPMSFANLQSWSCVPGTTCSIAVGPKKYVLQTDLGEDICSLLKAYLPGTMSCTVAISCDGMPESYFLALLSGS